MCREIDITRVVMSFAFVGEGRELEDDLDMQTGAWFEDSEVFVQLTLMTKHWRSSRECITRLIDT